MMRRRRRIMRRVNKGPCYFCEHKVAVDYKEVAVLKKFTSDRGKIAAKSRSGLCQKHQKRVAQAIKRARHLALLPFVVGQR